MTEEVTKQEALAWVALHLRVIDGNPKISRTKEDHALDTLASIVREQEAEIAEYKHLERLYHQKDLCRCGDDEACQHVRRAEAAEAERDELLAQVYSLSGRSWQQCFLDADKENISLRERLKAAEGTIQILKDLDMIRGNPNAATEALAKYEGKV